MKSIVTLTVNPALDKSTTVENVVPKHKLRCAAPQWQAGGGGINVARVVKRLGGSPLAVYTCGGAQGKMLRDLLDEEGIRQTLMPIQGLTRQSFAVRETTSNQQYRFSVPGPRLSEEEWRSCLESVINLQPRPEYLVLSGGLPPGVPEDFYGRIAGWAQEQNVRIVLDTHHAPLRRAVEAGVYLVKPNLRELRQLTGQELDHEEEQAAALEDIVARGGAEVIVLSLGAAGAVFASREGIEQLRAPTVTIRSKVGAGDSMVGGIVWALAQGYAPPEAAQWGIAAGAAAVQTEGTELCNREDTAALYEQIAEKAAVA